MRTWQIAVAVVLLLSAGAWAQAKGGQLAPLASWVAKPQTKFPIDGKAAKALALNQDGGPAETLAVVTPWLDRHRSVHVFKAADRDYVIFGEQHQNNRKYFLTDHRGALIRAIDWPAISPNPKLLENAAATPAFNEHKKFWLDQLGRPVR